MSLKNSQSWLDKYAKKVVLTLTTFLYGNNESFTLNGAISSAFCYLDYYFNQWICVRINKLINI